MSIIYEFTNAGYGFFSQYWGMLSLYIFSKRKGMQFYLDDTKWLFRHTKGWRDYFSSMNIYSESEISQPVYRNIPHHLMEEFTLEEYCMADKDIFQLNINIKNKIQQYTFPENYDAILIRRGDKMILEATLIPVREYVEKLLEKGSKNIFVQTDDYSVVQEIKNLVKDYNIEIFTLCPNDRHGCFVYYSNIEDGSKVSNENMEYVRSVPKPKKQVNEYTSEEMKEHVEELLMAVEISRRSRYLVTDFQSNISRYLYVTHNNPENVITVRNEEKPNFNTIMKCPMYGFIKIS